VALELFKGPDQVDDASDAEVLGGAGAGFNGDGAERGGAALGEDYAVYAGAVGYAEKRAEILWIFDAVECEKQTRGAGFRGRIGFEEVFDGERLLRAHQSHNSLMGWGLRHMRQLLARLLADADTALPALGDQLLETGIVAFMGHQHVVKAAASGLESLFHRMHPVENFHEG
jgi:hypothetical protein